MKLAFSSLGMPGAGIDELIRCAEEGKADGLELRIAEGEAITKNMPATAQQTMRRRIEGAGLTLVAISSYIRICSPEPDVDVIRDLHETLELAAALGAGGVRVFPGADPGNGKAKDWDGLAARRLSAVAEVASSLDVELLLETHDSHPTGTDIARILRLVEPSGAAKAIWDVLHPWRHGEQLPGQGAIPIAAIAGMAEKVSRDQGDKTFWACLEWEKAWHPRLEELPEALTALRAVLMPEAAT